MTGQRMVVHPALVRDYERLCAAFPRAYRREHEVELLGHLVEAAPAGATRASTAERVDLLRSAAREWLLAPVGSTPRQRRDATRWLLVLVPLVLVPAAVTRLAWVAAVIANGRGMANILASEPAAPAWAVWSVAMLVLLAGGLRTARVLATVAAVMGWVAIGALCVAGHESKAFIEVGWVVGLTFAAVVVAQRAGWERPLGSPVWRRVGVALSVVAAGFVGWSAVSPSLLTTGNSWSVAVLGLPRLTSTSGVSVALIIAALAALVWSRSARQAAPAMVAVVTAVISARADVFGDRVIANGQVSVGHVFAVLALAAVTAAVARWIVNRLDEMALPRELLRTSTT